MLSNFLNFDEAESEHDVVDGGGDQGHADHYAGEHEVQLQDERDAYDVLKDEEGLDELPRPCIRSTLGCALCASTCRISCGVRGPRRWSIPAPGTPHQTNPSDP
jgi:hypothetical protein